MHDVGLIHLNSLYNLNTKDNCFLYFFICMSTTLMNKTKSPNIPSSLPFLLRDEQIFS